MNNYPRLQFSLFRVSLGSYLLYHFIFMSTAYSDYLWPTKGSEVKTPISLWVFYVGAIFGFLFALGVYRKIAAIGAWCALRFLLYKNIYYYGVNYDYAGFLLLLSLFVPDGEGFLLNKANKDWQMPQKVYWGAWIVFTLSMTVSGLNKYLISPEWASGNAIFILYTKSSIYSSEYFRKLILAAPDIFKLVTWIVLIYEVVSVSMLFSRHFRFFYSIMTILIFLTISIFSVMREVSINVLIFEILLFDVSYLKRRKNENKSC